MTGTPPFFGRAWTTCWRRPPSWNQVFARLGGPEMGSNQVPALPGGAKISVCRGHGVSRRGEDTVISVQGHRGAGGRRVLGVAEHGDLARP